MHLIFLRPSFRPAFGQSAKTNVEMVKKSKERAIVSYCGIKENWCILNVSDMIGCVDLSGRASGCLCWSDKGNNDPKRT